MTWSFFHPFLWLNAKLTNHPDVLNDLITPLRGFFESVENYFTKVIPAKPRITEETVAINDNYCLHIKLNWERTHGKFIGQI